MPDDFVLSARAIESPIFARFVGAPVLVSEEMRDRFEGCLVALAKDTKFAELAAMGAADDGFWPQPGHWMANYRPYIVDKGVLQIPVKGILLDDFSFAFGSWATGYVYIRRALERGLSDAEVRGIAFIHDSPGGTVSECFDLADRIYKARGAKPLRAFAEFSYSAAYALASSAGRVIMTRTGGVGSIGCLRIHVDISKAMDQAGVKVTLIEAPKGGHKTDGYPYKPLSSAAEGHMQARIDALYDVFVATVARNRRMTDKAVRETKGLTFMASEAMANGLADAVGVIADEVAAFAADPYLMPSSGDDEMSKEETAKFTQADVDKARAEGKTEGATEAKAAAKTETEAAVAAAKAEGAKEGAKAERERVKGIMALEEAKGREALAVVFATTTDMTADQAKTALAASPKADAQGRAGTSALGVVVDNPPAGGKQAAASVWDTTIAETNAAIKARSCAN